MDTITVLLTTILTGIILYLLFQLKAKKNDGLTLDESLQKIKQDIEEKAKEKFQLEENYKSMEAKLLHLIALEKNSEKLKTDFEASSKDKALLEKSIIEMELQKEELLGELEQVKLDLSLYMPVMDLVNLGHLPEPEFLFANSERFKEEIKIVRQKQVELIKSGQAIAIPDHVHLIADDSYSKKVLAGQTSLMLKSYNLECDNLIGSVKASNYPATLERITRTASEVEKSSISLMCGFTKEYVELKLQECELQYQFKKIENLEKIEQASIREQMREEEKARKEAEKAIKEAEREEEALKKALEKTRQDFDRASDEQKSKYEAMLHNLEARLQEAEEKNKRALSMAQQTKSGHVYIISNVGSFGDNMFKIGMTRRLEPMDRVKELGDASVPFEFDVHAMIYSENAPELETKLHQEFSESRVNLVNPRKEFFYVTLDEIEHWSKRENYNLRLTKFAEARAYRESEAIRARGEAKSAGEEMEAIEIRMGSALETEDDS